MTRDAAAGVSLRRFRQRHRPFLQTDHILRLPSFGHVCLPSSSDNNNAQPSHCCSVYVVGRDVACDIGANALLRIGFSLGMGMPASAAIPLPDLALALQEAKHLDQLPPVVPWGKAPIDHSGRNQKGHASYYSPKFAHKKMADGNHMNQQANIAASKTLPLGTTAKVINCKTANQRPSGWKIVAHSSRVA